MAKKKKGKMKRKYCAGNFRLPSPAAAKRFITKWNKLGVPAIGLDGLKTEKDVKIALIRLRQAKLISDAFDARVAKYEANRKIWADCKAAGTALKDCTGLDQGKLLPKPDAESHAKKGCTGNFRTPSKKNAKNYLKRFFRQFRTDITKFAPDSTGAFTFQGMTAKFGARGSSANFVQKLQTAIEVVGVAAAAEIAMSEIANSIGRANIKLEAIAKKLAKAEGSLTATEGKLQKKVEAAQKRLAAKKVALAEDKAKLDKYLDQMSGPAPAKKSKKGKGAKGKGKGAAKAKKAAAKPRRRLRRR
jgi:hypothetical protein